MRGAGRPAASGPAAPLRDRAGPRAKNDRTVIAVCHAGPRPAPTRRPSPRCRPGGAGPAARARRHPGAPVQLADIEAVAHQAATAYRAADPAGPLAGDRVGPAAAPERGVGGRGVDLLPVSVGRLAMTLHLLLREHRLALPDDAELLDELATVRLRESPTGRLPAGPRRERARRPGGGPRAGCLALTERGEGRASITSAADRIAPGAGDEPTTPAPRCRYAAVAADLPGDAPRAARRRVAAARLGQRPAAGAQHPRQLAPRQLAARLLTSLW